LSYLTKKEKKKLPNRTKSCSVWLTELTPVPVTVELSQHVYQYVNTDIDFNINVSGWPQVHREEKHAGRYGAWRAKGQMSRYLSFAGTGYTSWADM